VKRLISICALCLTTLFLVGVTAQPSESKRENVYMVPEAVESNSPNTPTQPPLVNQPEPAISPQIHNQALKLSNITGTQTVAILDTGIDRDHEDLKGLIIAEADFTDSSGPNDIYGHGTHVAGIIAAENEDGGIIGCQLLNCKVADNVGRCQAEALARGIIWAVNNGAKVINISIEIREPSPQLEEAVNYAWNEGAVIVAAAGNEGNQLPVYPAYYKNCIAVAATKQDGKLAPLSNYGDWVDVAAPGYNIYSTLPDNDYGYKTGTSFATAYVSGIAALLFNVVTDTNGDGRLNDEVRAAIESGFYLDKGGQFYEH